MRVSGKGMWWNVKEREGRRYLNVNVLIVIMLRIRKVIWEDIVVFDIMKLFLLWFIAVLMFVGN